MIDSNVFALDENDTLNLINFSEAVAGAHLVKGKDGKIEWKLPDNTTVEGLQIEIEKLKEVIGKKVTIDDQGDIIEESTGLYALIDKKAD